MTICLPEKDCGADHVFTWGSLRLLTMCLPKEDGICWPRCLPEEDGGCWQLVYLGRWRLLTTCFPRDDGGCWPRVLRGMMAAADQVFTWGRWRLLTTCLLYLWRMVAASYSLVWICRPGWDQPIGGVGDGVAVYSSPKQNAVLVGAVDLHQY